MTKDQIILARALLLSIFRPWGEDATECVKQATAWANKLEPLTPLQKPTDNVLDKTHTPTTPQVLVRRKGRPCKAPTQSSTT